MKLSKEQIEAVETVHKLLSESWLKIYAVSRGDMTSKLHKLRMDINSSQVLVNDILDNVHDNVQLRYKLYDMQDESDSRIVSLEGAREWLADFWNANPDHDMGNEEHGELIKGIMLSDADELAERLTGVDYFMELVDDETEVEEVEAIEKELRGEE